MTRQINLGRLVRGVRTSGARWRQRLHDANVARKRRGIGSPIRLSSPSAKLFVVLVATLAGLSTVLVLALQYLSPTTSGTQISFDQLQNLSAANRVHTALIYDFDHRVVGQYALQPAAAGGSAPATGAKPAASAPAQLAWFWTNYPSDGSATPQLLQTLTSGGATTTVVHQATKSMVQFLVQYVLPLVILANLFALIFVGTRSGGESMSGLLNFVRIGRKKGGDSSAITFADVAGADELVAEMREVRDYLSDPARYASMGAQPPKGVLLFGPPGCGKTLVAKAVAGEAGVPFFSISGAEFVEALVGVGAARVRDLFKQVREVAPAIVFIDEIDAAGRKRGGVAGGQEERDQTLNQLLIEMDGFEATAGIVVMGATNRPDILDPALLRPGRFDRQITVAPPDLHGREEILRLHSATRPVRPDVDFEYLARRTPGFTGADLANVINEATLLSVRNDRSDVGMDELEEAILRVLVGPQRKGHLMSNEERKRIALHESGHAVVAAAVGNIDDVQRLSIIARGRTMGQAVSAKRWQERTVLTRSEMRRELVVLTAGAAAEEVMLGEPSTGSDDDLDRATGLAQLMVGRFGMSERLGRMRMLRLEGSEFLGAEAIPDELTAGPVLMELHEEVRRMLEDAESTAREILVRHRSLLIDLAQLLEEKESLDASELSALLQVVRPEMNVVLDDEFEGLSSNGKSGKHGVVGTAPVR